MEFDIHLVNLIKNLPKEVIDRIFLWLPWNILENTREIQSKYVKDISKYETMSEAIIYKNLRNIEWLLNCGYLLEISTIYYVAKNGDLESVKWLRGRKCPWSKLVFNGAACNGHLDIIKWLFYNGCPWDKDTFSWAVQYGNIEIMEWMIKNGFSLAETSFYVAVRDENLITMEWLLKHGCPYYINTLLYLSQHVCKKRPIEIAHWLEENLIIL